MSGTEDAGLVITNLTEFFRGSLNDAMADVGVEASDETEFYLVNLLESFSKTDSLYGGQNEDEPLALMYGRAIESPSQDEAIPVFRRIGDVSLYMSGFFSRSLDRKAVSASYVQTMGRNAYESLHTIMETKRAQVFADIYAELSEKFPHIVEVFIALSEAHSFQSSDRTTDLIERWAHSRSSRAGEKLLQDGILPLWRFESDQEN